MVILLGDTGDQPIESILQLKTTQTEKDPCFTLYVFGQKYYRIISIFISDLCRDRDRIAVNEARNQIEQKNMGVRNFNFGRSHISYKSYRTTIGF